MTKSVVFEFQFSSAHFYHQPLWSIEKNQSEFGKCFTEYGHGHNYRLQVELEGLSDSELLFTKSKLKQIVDRLDHEHLNLVIPEFKNKIPTTEVIVEYFQDQIQKSITQNIANIRLFETDEIGAELFQTFL